MGYGYLLLSVKSEQDNYLIGNPQFTFFKAVYKKHTNFALDYQFSDFVGESSNSFGKKIYLNVPKNGDLLHRMYLTFDLGFNGAAGTSPLDEQKKVAPFLYNLIDHIDINIGGQLIDRQYGQWFAIWNDLLEPDSLALSNMTGIRNNLSSNTTNAASDTKTYTLPLRFWFNNNIGLSLPLIALQYTEIKLEIRLKNKDQFNTYAKGTKADGTDFNQVGDVSINKIRLVSELIHLDKDERRLFSTNNHEYLITQVQSSLNNSIYNYSDLYDKSTSNSWKTIEHNLELRFRYPIKEIFWGIQDIKGNYKNGDDQSAENVGIYAYNYWNNYKYGSEQMNNCRLVINGKDLMDSLNANFFRNIQQYQYYNGNGMEYIKITPNTTDGTVANTSVKDGLGIYGYSFSLKPSSVQPSGSVNFSKLESALLKFSLNENTEIGVNTAGNGNKTNKLISVFGVNYNVLRIMSGMAGLAFVN